MKETAGEAELVVKQRTGGLTRALQGSLTRVLSSSPVPDTLGFLPFPSPLLAAAPVFAWSVAGDCRLLQEEGEEVALPPAPLGWTRAWPEQPDGHSVFGR